MSPEVIVGAAACVAAAGFAGVVWKETQRRRKRQRRAERRRRNIAYERAWNLIIRKPTPRLTYRPDEER